MSYHDDPQVNEIILTVINDGNGNQCGADYSERCRIAQHAEVDSARYRFRGIARAYDRYSHRVYGHPLRTLKQTSEAGDYLAKYYAEHVKECEVTDAETKG